jgi:hypothetical protein
VWWELPLGLLVLLAAETLSRASIGDKPVAALAHARQVSAIESRLGLNLEMIANTWLTSRPWLAEPAGYLYAAGYLLTSVAVLVFLYVYSPPVYRWARRSCLLLNLGAAACFAVYPVAPPRLNPNLSVVDVVEGQHIWGTWGSPVGDRANELAALPSLHFALVLWVLVMLVVATRSVVLITLASVNVVLTAVVVVATGNHYPLDLVAGAGLALISIPATHSWRHPPQMRLLPDRMVDFLRSSAVLTVKTTDR